MLFLENFIRALLIFNELRSRHCQRALLGYHYPRASVPRSTLPIGGHTDLPRLGSSHAVESARLLLERVPVRGLLAARRKSNVVRAGRGSTSSPPSLWTLLDAFVWPTTTAS